MIKDRYRELQAGQSELTQEEIDIGWHFCLEWDDMLCHPSWPEANVCGCEVKKWKELKITK